MTNRCRIKSEKYCGVYWNVVQRADGRGDERLYYIVYRRSGERKQIEEKLGKSSDGWTEARASRERAARQAGKESNSERRERKRKDALLGEGPKTIDRLWQLYLANHKTNRSIRDDINRYNKNLLKPMGHMEIGQITTSHIASLRSALERRGLSPQSVKHCLGLLKRIIRHAASLEVIPMPANIQFNMPVVDNKKTENMTDAQMARYWAALEAEPDQVGAAFYKIALLTAMRKGAICGLRWDDLDFDNNQITLRAESAKNGKTSFLPMTQTVKEIFQSLPVNSEYVFPGRNGGRRTCAPKMGPRVRDLAGLPKDYRPVHGHRHTYASRLASSGEVSLYELQHLLTHSSPTVTQRYAHLADEALRKAANVADKMIQDKDKE